MGVTTATDATFVVMGTNIKSIQTACPNGTKWTASGSIYKNSAHATALYCSNGVWVVGFSDYTVYYSLDGKAWTQTETCWVNDFFYSDGILAAALKTDGIIYSSNNGKTWSWPNDQDGIAGPSSNSYDCIHYGNGIWVAGCMDGLYCSSDSCVTWDESDLMNAYVYSIHYANGIFVAGTGSDLYYSTNGINWSLCNSTSGSDFIKVYYADGWWVAIGIGTDSNYHVFRTTDPKARWFSSTTSFGSVTINDIKYANGVWVVATEGSGIYYCNNRTPSVFSQVPQTANGYLEYSVAYGNGKWVVAGDQFFCSNDGLNWSDGYGDTCNLVYYSDGMWVSSSSLVGRMWVSPAS